MILLQAEIAGGMYMMQIAGIILLIAIIVLGLIFFIRQENKGLSNNTKNKQKE